MSVFFSVCCLVWPWRVLTLNVTFPNGIGANRGLKLTLGGQVQGMRMSTILNNTRVRNILDCPDNTTYAFVGCQGASGSVYDTTRGSFSQVVNIHDWNVTIVDAQPDDGYTTVLHGYDVANFTDAPAVAFGYPFEVWADYDSMNKSALAFGPNSSTLESFVRNRLAPAASFSMDYGSTSELYPRDGQLIIGGYNEARFNDSKVTKFPLWGANAPVPCPLQVTVSDIILTNKDGDHSLFSPGVRVAACIDPVQNSFTFTPAMFDKFQKLGNHTESDGKAFNGSEFPTNREPLLGSLTIKLSNGYTSVIPHYELVSHVRGTDSRGKYAVLNNTRISTTVSSGLSDLGDNIPILGGVFLSQNYLHVDYNAGNFWLSPQVANGTLPDHITAACNGTSSTTTSTSALGLKVGVPVAIGVAVVFFIGLWFWLKNRKRNPQTQFTDAPRSIPRNEKRDAPDSKSSTTNFAGYNNVNHANPGAHMELEGDLGRSAVTQQRAELAEPVPAYKSEWPRQNSIQGENDSYYRQFEEPGESYELADTSPYSQVVTPPTNPPPVQRKDTGLSETWVPSPATLRKQMSGFSDAVSPASTRANSTRIYSHVSPV
ncbi:aspartic-type endopeptidase [Colletotrichum tofieldiae]|nr:aspartic-type endopeptidase [Colletotrichum tofieldiae]